MLLVPPSPSIAQTETTATVRAYIGDIRTGPDTIGPLEGATFGLFATSPAATIDNHDGFTAETPMYSCTSTADGWCTFQVDTTTLPANGRLWMAATGAPDGRYANPEWQTAPLSPTPENTYSLRHVFQTPELVAGQTYSSYGQGRTWITDPGLQTSPRSSVPDFQRRTASGGVVPISRRAPELPDTCGLKVALVVDLSSSVSGYVDEIKGALDSFVQSLRGTPSQAALFTFGSDSPANGYVGPGSRVRGGHQRGRAGGSALRHGDHADRRQPDRVRPEPDVRIRHGRPEQRLHPVPRVG